MVREHASGFFTWSRVVAVKNEMSYAVRPALSQSFTSVHGNQNFSCMMRRFSSVKKRLRQFDPERVVPGGRYRVELLCCETVGDSGTEDADVLRKVLLLCDLESKMQREDTDDLLCALGRERGDSVDPTQRKNSSEAFEFVMWHVGRVGSTGDADFLEVGEG